MSDDATSLVDRMELRRFVGREFLLWLWFESELFSATLETTEHGSFGMWVEGRLALTEDRESTIIKGTSPGFHRDAKEALLRGKTPERAAFHVSWGAGDFTFTLRGDTLAVAGLSPPAPPARDEAPAIEAPPLRPRKKKRGGEEEGAAKADDALAERMHHARDAEALLEALYRDFLTLRLSPAWDAHVVPAIEAWAAGEDVDEDAYRAARAQRARSGRRSRS